MEPLSELKILCREKQVPYFDDEELQYQLERANGDVNLAAYRCLIIKAENCAVQVTHTDWLRLASSVRPSGSCIVKGG